MEEEASPGKEAAAALWRAFRKFAVYLAMLLAL
jgi:hypothetical protein